MAAQKEYEFSADGFYPLLTHYSDGEVPLNGRVVAIQFLPGFRLIRLVVDSDEWETDQPLQIRYHDKRIATWTQGSDEPWSFEQRAETPKLQS